jgi:hypothetical protein
MALRKMYFVPGKGGAPPLLRAEPQARPDRPPPAPVKKRKTKQKPGLVASRVARRAAKRRRLARRVPKPSRVARRAPKPSRVARRAVKISVW